MPKARGTVVSLSEDYFWENKNTAFENLWTENLEPTASFFTVSMILHIANPVFKIVFAYRVLLCSVITIHSNGRTIVTNDNKTWKKNLSLTPPPLLLAFTLPLTLSILLSPSQSPLPLPLHLSFFPSSSLLLFLPISLPLPLVLSFPLPFHLTPLLPLSFFSLPISISLSLFLSFLFPSPSPSSYTHLSAALSPTLTSESVREFPREEDVGQFALAVGLLGVVRLGEVQVVPVHTSLCR